MRTARPTAPTPPRKPSAPSIERSNRLLVGGATALRSVVSWSEIFAVAPSRSVPAFAFRAEASARRASSRASSSRTRTSAARPGSARAARSFRIVRRSEAILAFCAATTPSRSCCESCWERTVPSPDSRSSASWTRDAGTRSSRYETPGPFPVVVFTDAA